MEGTQLRIGEADYWGKSTLHPVGVTLLLLFGFAMVVLPRRHAMVTMLACASFIAVGQRVVVASLDFNFMRIMVLFGWARLIIRQEYRGFQWNRTDLVLIAFAIAQLTTYTITVGGAGFVWRLGSEFDAIGAYFLARMLIRDLNDVRNLIYGLAIISIPIAVIFLIERSTSRNLFAVFGGVPEFTVARGGKLRCQGAYSHPILAGCFWAVIFPFFASQMFSKGLSRVLAFVGTISSLVIIYCCASSTPFTGVIGAMIGFALMPLRKNMSAVRWTFTAFLLCLHMVMKAPVWHLIARTDFVGGSTGWHRAHLIDKVIEHFWEWALHGVNNIAHWDIYGNDVCNQFCLNAVNGGVLTLVLFIWLIASAFANVGRGWRRVERSPDDLRLTWAIGVSLFVHIVNFIGVAYFGQIEMLWYIGLALTSAVPSARSPVRSYSATLMTNARFPATRFAPDLRSGYR